jgi:AraC-like DNA-binding protein
MAVINYIGRHLTTYDVVRHSHKYWEIIYTTSGMGHISTSEGIQLSYSANQVIVIPPNVVHTNTSNSGFNNIHLTLDNWNPLFKKTFLVEDYPTKDLLSAMTQAHRYYHMNITGRANIVFALTELIVNFVSALVENPASSSTTQLIENEIINHYTDSSFIIDDIFSKIPYAKEYVRKLFIKERGISPLQYLINKRIEYAMKLLAGRKESDQNIREIAEQCGFSDQLYFSRIFKKIVGVPPKDYVPDDLADNKIF